jgi:acyl-CoA thioesterase-1
MGMRLFLCFALLTCFAAPAMAEPMRIVALGDSLTAGSGLPKGEDFATKLEAALIAQGLNVKIENAGVGGNTTADGRARLEEAIKGEPKPRLVIVALGANDMLRRLPPAEAKENLRAILQLLKDRNIPAFLIGMQNPMGGPLMKGPYAKVFEDLEDEFDVPLYPFFLEGVALDSALNQGDGFHPNEKGVAVMVENIAPEVADVLGD